MNKGDLIEAVSREADLSKAAATRAVDSVLKTIVKTVSKKQTVQLIGFGTFPVSYTHLTLPTTPYV